MTSIVLMLVIVLIIWRIKQKKELFAKLSFGEKIYTSLIYVMSLFIIFWTASKLLTAIKTFELNGLIETFIFLIILAFGLWLIVTIWSKILPKKVLEDL
ncbi:hypothetical protein DCE79_10605 [Lysinibacillus sp. 2017]|uniref:hypothetical protein n=1 Tax=unclassified Lysinibacillus TaxID=2636778 RepID=UPI000D5267FF|nr:MULTISPECIES: hypothetical protein [unclassified Lysinibacillus]AWE07806.1 hypothetical protein DCE79_10605 [Lysinibacillus sp. 2017]TGN34627.1 hypothetical protein E4L99_13960 [Lysinibacillus sp. S2017]